MDAEEAQEMIDNVIVAAQNAEPCGDPYHETERLEAALAACRADAISHLCRPDPPEGAPTYGELVEALRDFLASDGMGFITRSEVRRVARALLSRIPKDRFAHFPRRTGERAAEPATPDPSDLDIDRGDDE